MASESISTVTASPLDRLRKYKREYARTWRRRNRDKVRAAKRRAYRRNPERAKAKVAAWRKANPEKVRALALRRKPNDREHSLKVKYKLTLDAWNALFDAQGRRCAACGVTEPGTKNGWHTDHCHKTKKVRGILCLHCNVGIGKAKDNIQTIRSWIDYLEKHNAPGSA